MGHVLKGSGHWVHFDQPAKLRSLLLDSFRQIAERQSGAAR